MFEPLLLQAKKALVGGLLRLPALSLLVFSRGAVNLSSFNVYLTERRRCITTNGFLLCEICHFNDHFGSHFTSHSV